MKEADKYEFQPNRYFFRHIGHEQTQLGRAVDNCTYDSTKDLLNRPDSAWLKPDSRPQIRNLSFRWGTKRIVVVIANGLPDSEIRLVTGDDSPRLRLSTIVASHTSVGFAWQSQKQSVVECFCWGVLGQIFQVFVKMAFSPLNCIHIGFSVKIQNRYPEIDPCAKFQPN